MNKLKCLKKSGCILLLTLTSIVNTLLARTSLGGEEAFENEMTDLETQITFGIARIADIGALLIVINSAYRKPGGWTNETALLNGSRTNEYELKDIISKSITEMVILVALTGNKIVGSVSVQNKGESAYLGMLAVDSSMQKNGLGKLLILKAESWVIKNWKINKMELSVMNQREELVQWYKRRGYRQYGEAVPFSHSDSSQIQEAQELTLITMSKDLD